MKRRKDQAGISVCVFSFHCSKPRMGGDVLERQLRLAHCYYNALIDLERWRREQFRSLCHAHSPEVAELDLILESLRGQLRHLAAQAANEKMIARSRQGASDKTEAEIQEIKNALRPVHEARGKAVSVLRKTNPGFLADLQSLDEQIEGRKSIVNKRPKRGPSRLKELRAEYGQKGLGLDWGTQAAISQAVDLARKSKVDPSFRRGVGRTGQVVIQFQGRGKEEEGQDKPLGLPVPLLFGDDSRIQIKPLRPGAYQGPRQDQRRAARTVMRFRLFDSETKKPCWLECAVTLHRQLPKNGLVKWGRIRVFEEGVQRHYELQLTLDVPSKPPVPVDVHNAVGIDLGWRWLGLDHGYGTRVAYTMNSQGEHASVQVVDPQRAPHNPTWTHRIHSGHQKAESLRSIRDRNFESIKQGLGAWVRDHAVPSWFTEALTGLAAWRRQSRLAVLWSGAPALGDLPALTGWVDRRFPGDEEIFSRVMVWRRQDRHHWNWEFNQRQKVLAFRREEYCKWAVQIARKYSLVCIEDFNLSKIARKPKAERGEQETYGDLARSQRIQSAPGELRSILENACRREGVTLVRVPCSYTTMTCHACGAVNEWDKAAQLIWTCEECGAVWDQDRNAAINILRAGVKSYERTTPPSRRAVDLAGGGDQIRRKSRTAVNRNTEHEPKPKEIYGQTQRTTDQA